jgi:DNA (cytosine-5)-methyltransferase 1
MSWLISKALMNSLSLQGLAAESLEDTSLDGEQSVQSNGKPIQQAYCAPDKMTAFSRLSRFGMTYKPLTESRGEELLTSYREGFLAKTSAQLEKERESMENEAGCGEKWRGSFTKYDLDTRLWKTHQCSLLGDLELFLETWPQWGLMRNGECWEQRTLEQTIRETESGFVPNGEDKFHTPNTTGLDGGSNSRKALKKRMDSWPTPDANCGARGTQELWTPKRKSGHQAQYSINQAVRDKMFPTPTAHNSKECASPSEYKRDTPSLATHAGGKLNPMWVEWLMGWPLGHTDLKPLAMDKSHFVQQQPGES